MSHPDLVSHPFLMPDYEARQRACEIYGWIMEVQSFARGTFILLRRRTGKELNYNGGKIFDDTIETCEIDCPLEDFIAIVAKK